MTTRKAKTSKLPQGGDYAYVADRVKEFREANPNGLIETSYVLSEDAEYVVFTARVLKDKSKAESAEATGHAMIKLNAAKAFEKGETQATGRALALLGYLASGEIASADEMADFYAYRKEKIDTIVATIKNMESMDELKKYFMSLGSMMAEEAIIKAKDDQKVKLTKPKAKTSENN